jgi:hypothetical protein
MSEPPPPERSADRRPVRMPAICRSSHGLRGEGWLEDISAVGCCFVSRAALFKTGSHVILRPGGLEGITGTVRWVQANRCGIEFTSPLYGAVLDHLCGQFGATTSHVMVEPPPAPQYSPPGEGRGHPLRRKLF